MSSNNLTKNEANHGEPQGPAAAPSKGRGICPPHADVIISLSSDVFELASDIAIANEQLPKCEQCAPLRVLTERLTNHLAQLRNRADPFGYGAVCAPLPAASYADPSPLDVSDPILPQTPADSPRGRSNSIKHAAQFWGPKGPPPQAPASQGPAPQQEDTVNRSALTADHLELLGGKVKPLMTLMTDAPEPPCHDNASYSGESDITDTCTVATPQTSFTRVQNVEQHTGSTAKVVIVRQAETNELFALKKFMCSHNKGSPKADKRHVPMRHFVNEMKALKCLAGHPYIVTAREFIHDIKNDQFYIVEEYLADGAMCKLKRSAVSRDIPHTPGTPLDNDRLAQFEAPEPQLIPRCLACIAFAVRRVHGRGYVHLDIKPDNVLLRRNRDTVDAILGDFGLARNVDEASSAAEEDAIKAKISPRDYLPPDHPKMVGMTVFMPPEHFCTELKQGMSAAEILRAQDMWALGATFYIAFFKVWPFFYRDHALLGGADVNLGATMRQYFDPANGKYYKTPQVSPFLDITQALGELNDPSVKFSTFLGTKYLMSNVLLAFLEPNPRKRITADEALQFVARAFRIEHASIPATLQSEAWCERASKLRDDVAARMVAAAQASSLPPSGSRPVQSFTRGSHGSPTEPQHAPVEPPAKVLSFASSRSSSVTSTGSHAPPPLPTNPPTSSNPRGRMGSSLSSGTSSTRSLIAAASEPPPSEPSPAPRRHPGPKRLSLSTSVEIDAARSALDMDVRTPKWADPWAKIGTIEIHDGSPTRAEAAIPDAPRPARPARATPEPDPSDTEVEETEREVL